MTTAASFRAAAGAIALMAAIGCATAACGREGSLERPGPMFGLPRTDLQDRGQGGGAGGAPIATNPSNAAPPSSGPSGNTSGGVAERPTSVTRDRNGVHTNDPEDNAPTTARDLRDPAQRLTPLSAAPIPGLSNPMGPPVSTQPPG